MRGDKVRRRQSTETLCCFTPRRPLCVCAAHVVCLFTEWLDLTGRNVDSLPFLLRLLLCLPLWFFSIHVSLFFISLSSPYLPLCLCVFFFGPPTQNSRFNSEGFLVNHTWNLPRVWTLFPRQRVLPRSQRAARETVTLIIPVIGFSSAEAVIYMRWHSVQTCRPSQPFSGKQLTAPLSPLPPSCTLFFSGFTTPSLSSSGYCLHTNTEDLLPKEWGAYKEVKLLVFLSVASDCLLVNWLLFLVVDIQRRVWREADMAKGLTLLLYDCRGW